MIIYFSGTGNTRWVANKIAQLTNDKIQDINSTVCSSDTLGIFFPIYAWGIPRAFVIQLQHFLQRTTENKSFDYTYVICTCGDDIGMTDREIRILLSKYGIRQVSICSIQMPETYIDLPGFKLDTPETAIEKINRAKNKIEILSKKILHKEYFGEVNRGSLPRIKSNVLRPLFYTLFVNDKGFDINSDLCIHCGKCARVCPVKNIYYNSNEVPQFLHHCTGCLACYHHCPKNAIQRKFTKGKKQYLPPQN